MNPGFESFEWPRVVVGTSSFGNLFRIMSDDVRFSIAKDVFETSKDRPLFDTAGKYGAGLALETLGTSLRRLKVSQEQVVISNKLGWYRTELKTPEPTFEPDVWKGLTHDAVQKISYTGILECFEQGNELLQGYIPQFVSVHDPDEYISSATSVQHRARLLSDVLAAYNALNDLKLSGKVKAIGVGVKDWRIAELLSKSVSLDWVMLANTLSIKNHSPEVLEFINALARKGTVVIIAAVFHSGFLVGEDFYDYKQVSKNEKQHTHLFKWRNQFFTHCGNYQVSPASACVQFVLNIPGVRSVALNFSQQHHVRENFNLPSAYIPKEFWQALEAEGLITVNPFK